MPKPLTPLFPQNEKIHIIQGMVSDCYLLASLDCMFSSEEGLKKIKSLFIENPEGVFLRIPAKLASNSLNAAKLNSRGKYKHYRDVDTQEEIFFIPNEQLIDIDKEDSKGVKTNALAVKILEHVFPYYFRYDWDSKTAEASLKAHGVKGQGERFEKMVDGAFIAALTKVQTADLSLTSKSSQDEDLQKLLRLKMLNPDHPVYIGIDFENSHNERGRHGLRLAEIRPNQAGSYDFIMANPWDNQQKIVTYSLDEILKRDPKFIIYHIPKRNLALHSLLEDLPLEEVEYISLNQDVYQLLVDFSSVDFSLADIKLFNKNMIEGLLTLHKKIPHLSFFLQGLNEKEKNEFVKIMCAEGTLSTKEIINNLSRLSETQSELANSLKHQFQRANPGLKIVLKEGKAQQWWQGDVSEKALSYSLISDIIWQINKFPASFESIYEPDVVAQHKAQVIQALHETIEALTPAHLSPEEKNQITIHLNKKSQEINESASKRHRYLKAAETIEYNAIKQIEAFSFSLKTSSMKVLSLQEKLIFLNLHDLVDENPNLQGFQSQGYPFSGVKKALKSKEEEIKLALSIQKQLLAVDLLESIITDTPKKLSECTTIEDLNEEKEEAFNLLDRIKTHPKIVTILEKNKLHHSILDEFIDEKREEINNLYYERVTLLGESTTTLLNCMKALDAIVLDFSELITTSDIESHAQALREKVIELVSSEEVKKAKKVLSDVHLLDIALDVKLKNITRRKEDRLRVVDESATILLDCIAEIEGIAVDYSNLSTEVEVEAHAKKLIEQARGMLKDENIQNASIILNEYANVVELAVEKKVTEITHKKEEQLLIFSANALLANIQKVNYSFSTANSITQISALHEKYKCLLEEAKEKLIAMLPSDHKGRIEKLIDEKLQQINELANEAKNEYLTHQEKSVKSISENIELQTHLDSFLHKTEELEQQAEKTADPKVKAAAISARATYNKLAQAKEDLKNCLPSEELKETLNNLYQKGQKAIEESRGILEKYQGWKEVFEKVDNCLHKMTSLFDTYSPTNRFRMHNDSLRKLQQSEEMNNDLLKGPT